MKIERCLNLELRKANRVLTQIYDNYLSTSGIKTSQFSVLRAIYFLKSTTNRQLQDVLVLDQTSLTRALKPLIRDGFITVSSGTDKRQKHLTLSSEGCELYEFALSRWAEAQQKVSGLLGSEVLEKLFDVSSTIVKMK